MKAKQWLFDNGHIKEITRGRMSRDNIALIEQAVRDGVSIDGYAVSKVEPKTPEQKASPKVDRVSDSGRIADVPDETRPESSWQAHTFDEGSKVSVGMRTVCNQCGSSLTYCACRTPMVWIDHERQGLVSFNHRSKALPNKRW